MPRLTDARPVAESVAVHLPEDARLEKTLFGHDATGGSVWLYRLRNGRGVQVAITNYGAIVQSIQLPDRQGRMADVVLGFDDLAGYLEHASAYFGAIVGRYASRIRGAAFELGGQRFALAANHGRHSLHGGERGFDKRTWSVAAEGEQSLSLAYVSADGEEGYPGELTVRATYSLNERNELRLDMEAETTVVTVLNLTDHSDFNLGGAGSGDVLEHRLTVASDRYLPVGEGLAPTGELRSVEGTPFDFREGKAIGEGIGQGDEQIRLGGGYDHTLALTEWDGHLRAAARVLEPRSGRILEVHTTQPGLHFYSGNFLDGSIVGKSSLRYGHRGTFYLGAQHFPDSPNQPGFPSTVLRPGETFRATNLYRFGVDSTWQDASSQVTA
jgi:aldose 1-epimerase